LRIDIRILIITIISSAGIIAKGILILVSANKTGTLKALLIRGTESRAAPAVVMTTSDVDARTVTHYERTGAAGHVLSNAWIIPVLVAPERK